MIDNMLMQSYISQFDFVVRLCLCVSGVAISVHYLLMANHMKRAPHIIKALILPLAAASGVGMTVCSLSGMVEYAMIFASLAGGMMVTINIWAWTAGAYVSEQFDQAARVQEQINQDGRAFISRLERLSYPVSRNSKRQKIDLEID